MVAVPTLVAPVLFFDLDGTLTDSAPGILASFQHALSTVGREPAPQAVLDHVVGPPMRDTMAGLGLAGNELETALAGYFDRYDTRGWSQNEVYGGIPELLTDLRAAGGRLAVATSKSERFAVRILEHFGLAGHFEFIGAASDDGARRRKADVIAHTLAALDLEPGRTQVVMIGDRVHDVTGAAAHGIESVAVEWGYGTADEHAQARWVVSDVNALRALLFGGEDVE